MNSKKTLIGILVTAILGLASQVALAQDGGLIQVAEVKVKTGQLQEFMALQRALAEAGRDAGRTGRDVWQVMHGGTNTFHIVEPRANFAAFDDGPNMPMSDDEWTEWVGKIVPTIDTRTVWTLRGHPDLSIPTADDYEENLIWLRIRTVKPGMNAAYAAWVRDDLIPKLRDGGATGIDWFQGVTGLSGNTWFSVSRHPNYADMDPPGPLDGMGADAMGALLDRGAALQTSDSQNLVVQHRPDLSW